MSAYNHTDHDRPYEPLSQKTHANDLPSFWTTPYHHQSFNNLGASKAQPVETLEDYDANITASNLDAHQAHGTTLSLKPIPSRSSFYDPHHPAMPLNEASGGFKPSVSATSQRSDGTFHSAPNLLVNGVHDHTPWAHFPHSTEPTPGTGTGIGFSQDPHDSGLEEGELSVGELEEAHTKPLRSDMSDSKPLRIDGQKLPTKDDFGAAQELVRELFAWGLSFEDMLNEVTNVEALRAVFISAGLPVHVHSNQADGTSLPDPWTNGTRESSEYQSGPLESFILNDQATEETSVPNVIRSVEDQTSTTTIAGSSTPAEHLPLDRKAVIAQKLAAKKAKTPNHTIREDVVSEPAASQHMTIEKASILPPPSPNGLIRKPTNLPSDAGVERKAQTELARQKIEALRQRSSTTKRKEEAVNIISSMGTTANNTSSASYTLADPKSSDHIISPSMVIPRKDTYFSPLSPASAFNIPGLFSVVHDISMDEANRGQGENNARDRMPQSVSPVGKDLILKDSPRPMSALHVAKQLEGERSAEVPSLKKRLRGSESPRLPPRPFGFPTSHDDPGVIIDISDHESDTPDTSYVSNQNVDISNADGSLPGISMRTFNSDAAGDHTFRSKSVGSAQRSRSDNENAKIQDPEDLRAKELEIQTMNRKIAELQANLRARKTKQMASGPQSPGNSQSSGEPSGVASLTAQEDSPFTPGAKPEATTQADGDSPAVAMIEITPSREDSISSQSLRVNIGQSTEIQSAGAVPKASDAFQAPSDRGKDMYIWRPVHSTRHKSSSQRVSQGPEGRRLNQYEDVEDHGTVNKQASRRMDIEAGLPLLDREILRSKEKLGALKQQEAQLEAEIQKGLEGKQRLLDELQRLSQNATRSDPGDVLSVALGKSHPAFGATAPVLMDMSEEQLDDADIQEDRVKIGSAFLPPNTAINMQAGAQDIASGSDSHHGTNPTYMLEMSDEVSHGLAEQQDAIMDVSSTGTDEDQWSPEAADDHEHHPPYTPEEDETVDVAFEARQSGEQEGMNAMEINRPDIGPLHDIDDNMELYEPNDDLILNLEDKEIYDPSNESPNPGASHEQPMTTDHSDTEPGSHVAHSVVNDPMSERGLDTASPVSYEPPAATSLNEAPHEASQHEMSSGMIDENPPKSSLANANPSDDEYEPPEPSSSAEVAPEMSTHHTEGQELATSSIGNVDEDIVGGFDQVQRS